MLKDINQIVSTHHHDHHFGIIEQPPTESSSSSLQGGQFAATAISNNFAITSKAPPVETRKAKMSFISP